MTSSNTDNPGLVTGHAKLAQGIVSSAIGNLTGSQGLQQSGEQTKQAGVDELKSYQEKNPPSGNGSGIEQKVGQAVGCEGMVNDAQGTTTGSSTGSSVIQDDGQVNSAQGKLGGAEQPGLGTGGAQSDAGSRGSMPERVV